MNKRSDRTTRASRTILFSAKGKKYTQSDAERLSKYDNLILICGRYEGVDERVAEHIADEEISIGDYVLSGGEAAAWVITEAVTRLIPGVVGDKESVENDSFYRENIFDWPHYTRPFKYRGWTVPKILISGNHKKIQVWRRKKALEKTFCRRPDLLAKEKNYE